jgi:RecJ-like exonuclease
MECPACHGKGKVTAPYSSSYTCPWCEGEGTITQEQLDAQTYPRGGYMYKVCCGKAKELPRTCVCAFRTWCPEHGSRCHGTHD